MKTKKNGVVLPGQKSPFLKKKNKNEKEFWSCPRISNSLSRHDNKLFQLERGEISFFFLVMDDEIKARQNVYEKEERNRVKGNK